MEPNQLFFNLRALQYDYCDCKGNHGPILKQFTGILNRYQKNFYNWEPVEKEDYEAPQSEHSLISELIFVAIVGILFFLLCIASHSTFIAVLFYVIAGIAFYVRKDNPVWAVLSISLILAFMLVGLILKNNFSVVPKYIFVVTLILYLLTSVVKSFSDVGMKSEYKSKYKNKLSEMERIEKELSNDRQKMNELLPSLASEFEKKVKELVASSDEIIDEKVLSCCNTLPAIFWWQISPQELEQFEKSYVVDEVSSDVVWETRWVNRSKGKEFAYAGYEYSPLIEAAETSEEYKQIYDETKEEFLQGDNGAGVFDFISRGTVSSITTDTFQYEEYRYSDFKRFSKKMLWASVGNDIDDARKKGKITESQYANLSAEYIFSSPGVYSNIDEKVEKTGTKYRQIKTSTNIWVGQMLLVNDDEADGIAIVDYRCQIPHLFKNIDALADVKITRILGDPLSRNPMVMAKFHKVCELCR